VLDVALAADPANRYATANEFASALSQVMKQAVGVDPATALGMAVREARAREQASAHDAVPRSKRASVDIEFSSADANAVPLDPKK
jgi:hypothetical protein